MSALAQKPAGIGSRKFSVLSGATRAVELAHKDLILKQGEK
jgi:hypothetical protein